MIHVQTVKSYEKQQLLLRSAIGKVRYRSFFGFVISLIGFALVIFGGLTSIVSVSSIVCFFILAAGVALLFSGIILGMMLYRKKLHLDKQAVLLRNDLKMGKDLSLSCNLILQEILDNEKKSLEILPEFQDVSRTWKESINKIQDILTSCAMDKVPLASALRFELTSEMKRIETLCFYMSECFNLIVQVTKDMDTSQNLFVKADWAEGYIKIFNGRFQDLLNQITELANSSLNVAVVSKESRGYLVRFKKERDTLMDSVAVLKHVDKGLLNNWDIKLSDAKNNLLSMTESFEKEQLVHCFPIVVNQGRDYFINFLEKTYEELISQRNPGPLKTTGFEDVNRLCQQAVSSLQERVSSVDELRNCFLNEIHFFRKESGLNEQTQVISRIPPCSDEESVIRILEILSAEHPEISSGKLEEFNLGIVSVLRFATNLVRLNHTSIEEDLQASLLTRIIQDVGKVTLPILDSGSPVGFDPECSIGDLYKTFGCFVTFLANLQEELTRCRQRSYEIDGMKQQLLSFAFFPIKKMFIDRRCSSVLNEYEKFRKHRSDAAIERGAVERALACKTKELGLLEAKIESFEGINDFLKRRIDLEMSLRESPGSDLLLRRLSFLKQEFESGNPSAEERCWFYDTRFEDVPVIMTWFEEARSYVSVIRGYNEAIFQEMQLFLNLLHLQFLVGDLQSPERSQASSYQDLVNYETEVIPLVKEGKRISGIVREIGSEEIACYLEGICEQIESIKERRKRE